MLDSGLQGQRGDRGMSDENRRVIIAALAKRALDSDRASWRQIAEELGITLATLYRLRGLREYKDKLAELSGKVQKAIEYDLKKDTLRVRHKLNTATEEAISKLIHLMRNGKTEKIQLEATVEILDRDGRFAKVSRMMNVNQGQDGAPMLPEDAAAEILEALKQHQGSIQ